MRSAAARLRVTTIGRPVDLRVSTNRAVVLLSSTVLLAGLAVSLVRGEAFGPALISGLTWAGSAFLAWVLARETDPDRWYSAFFAAAGGLASAVLLGPPSFPFLFWFVIGLRYIDRSTGVAPGVLDFATLYGIKLWLGFTAHWTVPLLTFPTVFFADLQRLPRGLQIALPLALPVAAAILGAVRGWHFLVPDWGWVEIGVLSAVALLAVPVIVSYRSVKSVGDRTGEPLKPHRVQWAIGWTVVAAVILSFSGTSTIQDLGPLWAAFAGTSLGWAYERLAKGPGLG